MITINKSKQSILVTVKQLASHPRYEWLTESALRHHIYGVDPTVNSKGDVVEGNGLDKAIIRLGRKVLIDIDEFDRWVKSHGM